MRVAFVLLAVVLALAACGDDDGGDGLSKDEFVRAADAICAEYDERLARLPEPESIEDLAELTRRALPLAREGVRRLRALEPPDELASQVNEWLERNDENIRAIEELREAALAGDETRVQVLASAGDDNERAADALAREIGLRDCAAGPESP